MGFADALAVADQAAREVLGQQVVYTPGTGSPVTVDGIFDAVYVNVDAGHDTGMATTGPAVWLALADLPTDPETDTAAMVTVGGSTYKPWVVKPDGLGTVLLLLHLTT